MAGSGHALPAGFIRWRHNPGAFRAWPYVAAAAVVVAGAAAFYPRVSLAAGGPSLAQVSTNSVATHITNLRVSWPGGSVGA
jgi:hypothetical protein